MLQDKPEGKVGGTDPQWFKETHWSVVLDVAHADPVRRAEALNQLCRTYWEPIYAYIRYRGRSVHDAQDLTQSFFAMLLDKKVLEAANPEKGRFRSYLLGCVNNFLGNEYAKAQAQKRGGGKIIVPLDTETAEKHYLQNSTENLTAQQHFDRRWALILLDRALARLSGEALAAGRAEQFEVLKAFLSADGSEASCEKVSERLKMTPGAVRKEVYRLRRRLRKLIRAEVAHTVSNPDDIDAEMRYLISLLGQ